MTTKDNFNLKSLGLVDISKLVEIGTRRDRDISELAEIGANRDISAGLSRELFKTIALLAALNNTLWSDAAALVSGRLATDETNALTRALNHQGMVFKIRTELARYQDDADTNAVDVIERIKDVLDTDQPAGLVFTHAEPSGLEY